jgi:hypothetical protein
VPNIYDVSGNDATPVFRLYAALLLYKLTNFKNYMLWEQTDVSISVHFRHSVHLACPACALVAMKSRIIVQHRQSLTNFKNYMLWEQNDVSISVHF